MAEVIQRDHQSRMNDLAVFIDGLLNGDQMGKDPKVGFVLLCFDFDKADRSRMNYISNGQRPDIIVALKELVARFEGRVVETETRQ